MAHDLFGIAALFVGVAFVALLVSHPEGTARVVKSVTEGFGYDLATVSLAGGAAGGMGGFSMPQMSF